EPTKINNMMNTLKVQLQDFGKVVQEKILLILWVQGKQTC
ncbi:MAG: hypothetical protein MPEBLZ_00874, partial [Candidatus Methanoperedens nitroreducens]